VRPTQHATEPTAAVRSTHTHTPPFAPPTYSPTCLLHQSAASQTQPANTLVQHTHPCHTDHRYWTHWTLTRHYSVRPHSPLAICGINSTLALTMLKLAVTESSCTGQWHTHTSDWV